MAKGGARPGAGRKKGQKDVKPRKGTEAQQESEQIRQLLSLGIKAKAKFYQEFLFRVANADKKQKPLSIVEKKMMNTLGEDLKTGLGNDPKDDNPPTEEVDATDFLRKTWNDPKVEMALRIRAAEIAVRGAGEKADGKKKEKERAAVEASKGRFAAGKPPIHAVK